VAPTPARGFIRILCKRKTARLEPVSPVARGKLEERTGIWRTETLKELLGRKDEVLGVMSEELLGWN